MTKSNLAVVLLSGGLDSCVAAAIAQSLGYDLHFLNVYYGQRHSRERESATEIAHHYKSKITFLDIQGFSTMVKGATILTDPTQPVPANRTAEEMDNGQAPSYVPGRNTVMLSLAQSLAESVGARVVFCGVNAVDYSGYADCRPAFIKAWNHLAEVATFRGVGGDPIWVEAPLIELSKVDIVKRGIELGAPLHLTWSCYAGGSQPCGVCDSCQIRSAAFTAVGVPDPALYQGVK
jgi:7-cyano-7-deazaguanine synthase